MNTPTLNNTSLLASKAALIRFTASAWIGNPCDKTLTSEVQNNHNTEAKRISVRKKIGQGKELNRIAACVQKARANAERLSAPWLDGGLRIVAAKSLISAKLEIEKDMREIESAVADFMAAYTGPDGRTARDSVIYRRDMVALNGTFNPGDYPSVSAMRAKFSARLEILPIPSDFRVEGIDAAVRDELVADMEKLTASRVSDAKRDLISRIAETVKSLSGKLASMTDESRLHNSTVTNVTDACAEVKAANFDGDATLDTLADKVAATVAKLDADTLRESPDARADAQKVAADALAEIEQAMAGFVA